MTSILAIDLQRLAELLSYDPETGIIRWKIDMRGGRHHSSCKVRAGDEAGWMGALGYRWIWVDGKSRSAHRIAWALASGRWPEGALDHADGNRDNNCLSNLREASRSQNAANSKRRRDNASGFKGVHRHKGDLNWMARIQINGKRLHLGSFATAEEAHAAYCAAAARIFGEFARLE